MRIISLTWLSCLALYVLPFFAHADQYRQLSYQLQNPRCQKYPTGFAGECVCVVQKLKIDWAKKKAQPLTRFSWNSLKKQDLILIGDEHTYSDPAAALSLIKQMVTNSSKQCIFFELASSKTVQDLRTMVNTQSEDVQTDNLRKYFKSLLEGADALGIKAHLVDDPQSLGDPWHAPSLQQRNRSIGENIRAILDSGECDHSFMVLGQAHLSEGSPAYPSVPQIIKTLRPSTLITTMHIVFAHEIEPSWTDYSWNGICPDVQFTPSEPVIFENSGLKSYGYHLVPFKTDNYVMNYSDADFTALFP